MTGSSHSYEATMDHTSAFCTQKQVTKDGGVSGASAGLEALFELGETKDPLDPEVSLRTGRDYDMDGVTGPQPTVVRTTTTTSNNHESCPPGEESRDMPLTAALDPLVDPFSTSDLNYDHAVAPQIRTVAGLRQALDAPDVTRIAPSP